MRKTHVFEANRYYSTQELSRIFRANESTIKRWADSGKLPCFRTPGGHRKFTYDQISEFVNKYHYELIPYISTQQNLATNRLPQRMASADLEALREKHLDEPLRMDLNDLRDTVRSRYEQGIPLVDIYDNVVLKIAREILTRRVKEQISEVERHVATTSVFESLLQFTFLTPKLPLTGRVAVCSSRTNGLQEIVLFGTAHLLEASGWKVYNLGSHTPEPILLSAVEKYQPDVVCASIDYLIGVGAMDDLRSRAFRGLKKKKRDFLYLDFYAQAGYIAELTGITRPMKIFGRFRELMEFIGYKISPTRKTERREDQKSSHPLLAD